MLVVYTIVGTSLNTDGSVTLSLRADNDLSGAQITLPSGSALIPQCYVGRKLQAPWSFFP